MFQNEHCQQMEKYWDEKLICSKPKEFQDKCIGEKRKPNSKICYTGTNLLPKIGVKNKCVSANRVNMFPFPDVLANITKSGFASDDKSHECCDEWCK